MIVDMEVNFVFELLFGYSKTDIFYRAAENDDEVASLKLPWEIVEEKLMDALNAVEQGGKTAAGFKLAQDLPKRPLSLYAVDEGPRFRLLWASFQWLKKEAGTVYTLIKFQLHFFLLHVESR